MTDGPGTTIRSRRWRYAALATACASAFGLAILALIGSAGAVGAQEAVSPAPKLATSLSVTFEPSSMEGIPHYLAARLVAEDGSAVVGERVQIRRTADVFGGRTVTIGRASTDNAGVARVPVEPREEVYVISASFAGSETLAPTQVEDDIVFPAETVIIPEEAPRGGLVDPQLRPLAEVMPLAIGAGVAAVWVVLLGVSVVTLSRIRSSRRSDERASGQASAEAPGTGSGPRHG